MSARYEFIDGEKAVVTSSGAKKYTIVKMCTWMEVSKSGYYEWWGRPASATAERRSFLAPRRRQGVRGLRRDLWLPAGARPAGAVGRACQS